MKVRKIKPPKSLSAAAGLMLFAAVAAPNAFAMGAAGGAPGGGGIAVTSAPATGSATTGLPATPFRTPSSHVRERMTGAPVGAAEAAAMAGGLTVYTTSPYAMSLKRRMHRVDRVRYARAEVARQIARARARDFNVLPAEHDERLGNEALINGNHQEAMNYYSQAEERLRSAGYPAPRLASR